jgi:PAS domain S-box-containing protein
LVPREADAKNWHERETLLRLLSESIDEIFWFVGVEPARLIYVNPAVEEIMGLKAEELYRDVNAWMDCIHEEDRERVKQGYFLWLERKVPEYKMEFRIVRPNGEIRWLADHGALLFGTDGSIQFATGIAKDISEQKMAEEALRRLNSRLISAQEEERRRISRELHDHVSQTLAMLTVEMEQLMRHKAVTSEHRDLLAGMQERVRALSSDIHALSHQLHPSKLKHLGLVSAMRAMCRDVTRGGLSVDFTDHDIPRELPDDVSLALYRVMQEGLQNVRKHSGMDRAEARLSKTATALVLVLRDEGKGFNPVGSGAGSGLGLLSMRERLTAVGGTLTVWSAPGEGTAIEARVPLAHAQI